MRIKAKNDSNEVASAPVDDKETLQKMKSSNDKVANTTSNNHNKKIPLFLIIIFYIVLMVASIYFLLICIGTTVFSAEYDIIGVVGIIFFSLLLIINTFLFLSLVHEPKEKKNKHHTKNIVNEQQDGEAKV
ncbi:MAG: hypothetical protein WC196_04980 [Bacilli bacterium]